MAKKIIGAAMLLAFTAGLLFISDNDALAWGRKKEKEETKAEETVQASEPIVIYTFKDAEEMTGFEQLYVSKQATFGRMGVLQAYFAMEQNNLVGIDTQMEEKFGFKMDPSKTYDLNRDKLEIREVGPINPTPAALAE